MPSGARPTKSSLTARSASVRSSRGNDTNGGPPQISHGAMCTPRTATSGARSKQARALDEEAALLATGMGAAQIMGFNHRLAGFESAGQMFDAFRTSMRNQVLAFFDFIGDPDRITPEIQALQHGDLEAFAAKVSGPSEAARAVTQLNAAADAFRSLEVTK